MIVLAIDPGPTASALVVYQDSPARVLASLEGPNADVYAALGHWARGTAARKAGEVWCAIERVQGMGMPVGQPVFETVFWSGRFAEAWLTAGGDVLRPFFHHVRLHLCRASRANEANVRRALLDRLGEPGTKKAPGVTYGVHGHCWSALALAVTVADTLDAAAEVPAAWKEGLCG